MDDRCDLPLDIDYRSQTLAFASIRIHAEGALRKSAYPEDTAEDLSTGEVRQIEQPANLWGYGSIENEIEIVEVSK